MFAVVLVGGFGTRLRPLTNEVPKPMLPIGNKPMIVRLAERLADGGITDIVLALGFRPDVFQGAFPGGIVKGNNGEVRLHYAVEPEPLDTAGAIRFAAEHAGITDTFVVANGDVVTDLPIRVLVDEHNRLGKEATLHLTPVADPSAFGVVEVDSSGLVRRFVEKPAPGETTSNTINAGTYVFSAKVLDRIPLGVPTSVERVTFPQLVNDSQLAAFATHHSWIDTGRPEFYLEANLSYVGTADAVVASTVHETAVVESSVIGSSDVADGAEIRRSVLLPGAVIGSGARVTSSLVWGQVPADTSLTNCVVGAGYVVPAGDHRDEKFPQPQ